MKIIIVLIGVLGVALASPTGEVAKLNNSPLPYEARIFEDLINSTINSLTATAAKYDPLDVEHAERELLGHQGIIHNLHVAGFSNIVATHIKLSGLVTWTLELTLEAPRILGTLEQWKVEGEAFYGDGSARVEINDLKVKVKAKINPLAVQIKDLKITPSIGYADVSITGILNDEELSQDINNYLNDLLNNVINNDKELHEKISEIALAILQKILDSKLTV